MDGGLRTDTRNVKMERITSNRGAALATFAVAVSLAAVIAVVAAGALGRSGGTPAPIGTPVPTPVPTAPAPVPTPRVTPVPPPTPSPTPAPSDGPVTVVVRDASDHDVTAVVDDRTDTLVEVASGTPGDGMSVRWYTVDVQNVNANTVQVTFVGLPMDDVIDVTITDTADGYAIRLVQSPPPANSDAVGFDRILLLTFDAPVSADDIEASIGDR
jgi:hypothetical protein